MTPKRFILLISLAAAAMGTIWYFCRNKTSSDNSPPKKALSYQPRQPLDTSGFHFALAGLKRWRDPTSLDDIRKAFTRVGFRNIEQLDGVLAQERDPETRIKYSIVKTALLMYEGEPVKAYQVLQKARKHAQASETLRERWLYTIIFFQGVAGLRRGETENCLDCRGQGACIFPLRPTALHANPAGSRLAIKHFT